MMGGEDEKRGRGIGRGEAERKTGRKYVGGAARTVMTRRCEVDASVPSLMSMTGCDRQHAAHKPRQRGSAGPTHYVYSLL